MSTTRAICACHPAVSFQVESSFAECPGGRHGIVFIVCRQSPVGAWFIQDKWRSGSATMPIGSLRLNNHKVGNVQ